MKVLIKNLESVRSVLGGVSKVAPGCTFKLNSEGCEICSRSTDIRAKAFFETDSIIADGNLEFTFATLNKFSMALMALHDCGEDKNLELECNGTTLAYSGKTKFRLILDDPLCIEQYVYPKITTMLNDMFIFPLTNQQISTIRKYASINIQESKAYFYVNDGIVYVDIDDKLKKKVSSVTLPLTNKFKGDNLEPFCVAIKDMSLWTCLNADKMLVSLTDKYVLKVSSAIQNEDGTKVKLTLYGETQNG